MKQLKLKVGNVYLSREGEEVCIISGDGDGKFWSEYYSYDSNGNYCCKDCSHENDLISEVKDKTKDKPKKISQKKFDKKLQEVRESWGLACGFLDLTEFLDDFRNELFGNEGNK